MSRSTIARPAAGSRAGPQRKPGVRERAAQATRESLLRAAIKVFARHGLDGGSVGRIAAVAGSYERMIYYYFGSKEALFVAALEGYPQPAQGVRRVAVPLLPPAPAAAPSAPAPVQASPVR